MILRSASSWQTITADLALILFLVTAQGVGKEPIPSRQSEDRAEQVPVHAAELGVYRPATGEPVGEWLAATVTDERQVATVYIDYAPGNRGPAFAEGVRILEEAESTGVQARLIAKPGARDAVLITVSYLGVSGVGTKLDD